MPSPDLNRQATLQQIVAERLRALPPMLLFVLPSMLR